MKAVFNVIVALGVMVASPAETRAERVFHVAPGGKDSADGLAAIETRDGKS